MTEKLTDEQLRDDLAKFQAIGWQLRRENDALRADLEAAKATFEDEQASHQETLRQWTALRAERAKPTQSDAEWANETAKTYVCYWRPPYIAAKRMALSSVIQGRFASIRAEGSAERAKLEAALKLAMPFVAHSDRPSKKSILNQIRCLMGDPLAQPAESGATDALSEKCDNLRTLPDPHGVCAIKVELRRSLDDFCNSQTPVGMLCISPDDLTKLLNDHDALAECVLHFMQPAPAGAKP